MGLDSIQMGFPVNGTQWAWERGSASHPQIVITTEACMNAAAPRPACPPHSARGCAAEQLCTCKNTDTVLNCDSRSGASPVTAQRNKTAKAAAAQPSKADFVSADNQYLVAQKLSCSAMTHFRPALRAMIPTFMAAATARETAKLIAYLGGDSWVPQRNTWWRCSFQRHAEHGFCANRFCRRNCHTPLQDTRRQGPAPCLFLHTPETGGLLSSVRHSRSQDADMDKCATL